METPVAVSYDLFGTLVAVNSERAPADAIAAQLRDRDVTVPDGWTDAYRHQHRELEDGQELALPDHVRDVLEALGVTECDQQLIQEAVLEAFEADIATRDGAQRVVQATARQYPVGILSNCSVPSLARRVLARCAIDETQFDAIVTSVDCGWRKPHPNAFETIAAQLGCPVTELLHVGDDPGSDGGITDAGGDALLLEDVSLSGIPPVLEGSQ